MPFPDPPRYSITCQSDEEPIIHCLKALADYLERRRPEGRRAGVLAEREDQDGRIRLRFSHPDYRATFISLASDLFGARWAMLAESDDEPPAQPT